MLTRLIAKAALAVVPFALIGCASYPSTYGLDASSASMVRETCSEIMGLRVGPEAEACGGSLADTVRVLHDFSLTAQADEACSQQGLSRGAAEHSKCVVKFRRASGQAALFSARLSPETVPEAQPWQSYYSLSRLEQEERAELSCAQVGLHPASGGFSHCVSDLRFAIANIRYETMP